MSNAFALDGHEQLNAAEASIIDALFAQSREEPIVIALNQHLFEKIPHAVTVQTRTQLADIICNLTPSFRPIVVRRLAGMLLEHMQLGRSENEATEV